MNKTKRKIFETAMQLFADKGYEATSIEEIEKIVREGIEKGEIIDRDPEVIASEIFSLTSSCLIYKLKTEKNLDIQSMYKEIEKIAISGIMK